MEAIKKFVKSISGKAQLNEGDVILYFLAYFLMELGYTNEDIPPVECSDVINYMITVDNARIPLVVAPYNKDNDDELVEKCNMLNEYLVENNLGCGIVTNGIELRLCYKENVVQKVVLSNCLDFDVTTSCNSEQGYNIFDLTHDDGYYLCCIHRDNIVKSTQKVSGEQAVEYFLECLEAKKNKIVSLLWEECETYFLSNKGVLVDREVFGNVLTDFIDCLLPSDKPNKKVCIEESEVEEIEVGLDKKCLEELINCVNLLNKNKYKPRNVYIGDEFIEFKNWRSLIVRALNLLYVKKDRYNAYKQLDDYGSTFRIIEKGCTIPEGNEYKTHNLRSGDVLIIGVSGINLLGRLVDILKFYGEPRIKFEYDGGVVLEYGKVSKMYETFNTHFNLSNKQNIVKPAIVEKLESGVNSYSNQLFIQC